MSTDPAPQTLDEQREAMTAALARNWWAVGLRGLLGIAFGILTLFWPGATILALVLLFSAYMLVDGVFGIIAAVRAARSHERWGLLLLEGIVDIGAGVVAFVWPGITALAFVLILAFWAIVTGMLMIGAAFRLHGEDGRWWLVLGGAVSVIWGVLLAIMPAVGAIVLTWWIGAYALVFGCMLLPLAWKLWKRHHESGAGGTPSAHSAGEPA